MGCCVGHGWHTYWTPSGLPPEGPAAMSTGGAVTLIAGGVQSKHALAVCSHIAAGARADETHAESGQEVHNPLAAIHAMPCDGLGNLRITCPHPRIYVGITRNGPFQSLSLAFHAALGQASNARRRLRKWRDRIDASINVGIRGLSKGTKQGKNSRAELF
ncbi:hypothetical protein N657DRAFT_188068 [Parathielavia appendiculata]|uniref:Uncharacterized protein n=1 Tax=Parathielavia appendiculata TaxID=2587402 RepID=A0AAN6U5Y8_9PEZI|nr:hypothetical protein N657DRAFT_188068 [Parathielavia appendiculata]